MSGIGERLKRWRERLRMYDALGQAPDAVCQLLTDAEWMHAALVEYGRALADAANPNVECRDRYRAAGEAIHALALELARDEAAR